MKGRLTEPCGPGCDQSVGTGQRGNPPLIEWGSHGGPMHIGMSAAGSTPMSGTAEGERVLAQQDQGVNAAEQDRAIGQGEGDPEGKNPYGTGYSY
jgi:hypothetical protein